MPGTTCRAIIGSDEPLGRGVAEAPVCGMKRGLHPNARSRAGFGNHANMELMIVVAIIGIIAAIAIPKVAELIRKSNEGATKEGLAVLRRALSTHHEEHRGLYPYHPAALLPGGRYLLSMPKAKTPNYHPDSVAMRVGAAAADSDDSGGWLYAGEPASSEFGAVFVNCTHSDSKGTAWTAY